MRPGKTTQRSVIDKRFEGLDMTMNRSRILQDQSHRPRMQGFTLIELMITVAIIGILASIALPAYNDYIRRGQIQEAFGFLSDYRAKLEQYYQDNRNYGDGTSCAADPAASKWNNFKPGEAKFFKFECALGDAKSQSFELRATGIGGQAIGHVYRINNDGLRSTTTFKGVDLSSQCWLTRSTSCNN
jgi:type IV pilus assembly protein PilE